MLLQVLSDAARRNKLPQLETFSKRGEEVLFDNIARVSCVCCNAKKPLRRFDVWHTHMCHTPVTQYPPPLAPLQDRRNLQ